MDKVRKDGWVSSDGTTEGGFMQANGAKHVHHAKDNMLLHYTPYTEKFVDEHWKVEWQQDSYHFEDSMKQVQNQNHIENEVEGCISSKPLVFKC